MGLPCFQVYINTPTLYFFVCFVFSAREACSHIAAMLFKVEAAFKLELNHPSRTSSACVWNRYYREKVSHRAIILEIQTQHKISRIALKRLIEWILREIL